MSKVLVLLALVIPVAFAQTIPHMTSESQFIVEHIPSSSQPIMPAVSTGAISTANDGQQQPWTTQVPHMTKSTTGPSPTETHLTLNVAVSGGSLQKKIIGNRFSQVVIGACFGLAIVMV